MHRTGISEDRVFVLQLLRDQIGQHIYPVHRLDRATSGVLLFAKTPEIASLIGQQFMVQAIEKTYFAIVRGYMPADILVDNPVKNENRVAYDAVTHFTCLAQSELPLAINRYPTSRYSFVKVQPKTGRWHQIRLHCSHLRHPIIGDKRHGDNKHNNFLRGYLEQDRLLLHAHELIFQLPNFQKITLHAPMSGEFLQALEKLELLPEKTEKYEL